MSLSLITPYEANDLYRAVLRSTWISSPPASSLAVDALPTNVPTLITVGWGTDLETVFKITGVSGDSPSNYTLTGVVRHKGANENLPAGTAVNCLNHEEYFNQYGSTINEVITEVGTVSQNMSYVTVTDGATMLFDLEDGYNRKFQTTLTDARTFTVANILIGCPFIVRITQPAVAKVVTWFTGITITWQGTDGATATGIPANKTGTYGFIPTAAATMDGFFLGATS